MSNISTDDKFIYESCLSRISDLNKSAFQYRIIYLSVVASYFASLSFVDSISRNVAFLPAAEAFAVILMVVTVAALAVVSVLLFFDFVGQELIENALYPAAEVERSNACYVNRRMLHRPSSPFTSLYINSSIFLFYFISAITFFGISLFLSIKVFSKNFNNLMVETFSELCFVDYIQDTKGLIVDKNYDPVCIKNLSNLQFSEVTLDAVFILFYVALFFFSILVVVAFHRIFGRLLLCIMRPEYHESHQAGIGEMKWYAMKKSFDTCLNAIIVSLLAIGSGVFVGLLFRGWFLDLVRNWMFG